jgi:glycosyltransferase involved in cell wall biosynthesis
MRGAHVSSQTVTAMPAPAVSVILPCFERLRFLRSAVASVFAQTFSDWELVIVDDGSGSQVQAYLLEVAADPRVRTLRLAHSGNPAAVRNAGLRSAQGEYVAFIDSDDVWLPRKLEVQVASLRRREQCRWGYAAYDLIDAAGQAADRPDVQAWMRHEGRALDAAVRLRLMVALPSVLAERSLVEEVGGFDEGQRFYEDYDLWFRMALRSDADVVPEALLRVRKHDGHYSDTDRIRAAECKAAMLRRMFALLDEPALRKIVRRQRALCAASLARLLLAAPGGRSRAAQTLVESTRYSWPYARWWGSALRTLAASLAFRRAAPGGSRVERSEP